MTSPYKQLLAVVAAGTVLAGTATAATATAASSLRYQCSTSTKGIDDAGYSGPWPDTWDVTVQVCAARSGSTVHAYADVRWDGPAFYGTAAEILDGAKIRVQIMQSKTGTVPVVVERDFPLKARMERTASKGDHDGHFRTLTISHRAAGSAYGDGVLFLDWHKDGRGYRAHDYAGSPTV
ncbi:hypothetical protein [Streptomyces sp. NPDC051000]|uniref:hypothetical protein n=1 Tax=Streptomyces sp. NPDC051000 TaxID=3155520 RepID=UPI0033D90249